MGEISPAAVSLIPGARGGAAKKVSSGPNVLPVLMMNGDIDLQTPLENAERAKQDWPNSILVTIKDAPHVTIRWSECALRTALGFLQNPVLPDPRTCDSQPAPA